jgi:hypothetical protein
MAGEGPLPPRPAFLPIQSRAILPAFYARVGLLSDGPGSRFSMAKANRVGPLGGSHPKVDARQTIIPAIGCAFQM